MVEVVEVVEVEVEMVEAEGTPHLARVCRAPLDANVEHLGRVGRRHARAAHVAQPQECEAARGADGLRVTQHL